MSGLGIQVGGGMFGGDSIPVMEAVLRFAGQRQLVLLNNVANWNTPGFRATDLPEGEFQRALAEAIQRRASGGEALAIAGGGNIRSAGRGEFRVVPVAANTGSMRHDGNTVVIDQEQIKLLKNAMTVQVFNRLLSRKYRALRTAIAGRII
ncbi:MAG: flagellar basal body rod protein FlgB [Planctomycetota bacterium]